MLETFCSLVYPLKVTFTISCMVMDHHLKNNTTFKCRYLYFLITHESNKTTRLNHLFLEVMNFEAL